ncbi:hypothetical protein TNCV_2604111 [Trichonephila clavipes]|nr:hypothetical protein TNCV_2604111 [Trichonephila clavipes]
MLFLPKKVTFSKIEETICRGQPPTRIVRGCLKGSQVNGNQSMEGHLVAARVNWRRISDSQPWPAKGY